MPRLEHGQHLLFLICFYLAIRYLVFLLISAVAYGVFAFSTMGTPNDLCILVGEIVGKET